MEQSQKEKINDSIQKLAFHTGIFVSLIHNKDIEEYLNNNGFSLEKQDQLKNFVFEMSDMFYKGEYIY